MIKGVETNDPRQKENINVPRLRCRQVLSGNSVGTEIMFADYAEALSWRLDTFKPSDRQIFKSALQDPEQSEAARFAVKLYLMHWANSDWHDDSVRRLGRWLAINANDETKSKLTALLKADEHAVYQTFIEAMKQPTETN